MKLDNGLKILKKNHYDGDVFKKNHYDGDAFKKNHYDGDVFKKSRYDGDVFKHSCRFRSLKLLNYVFITVCFPHYLNS